TAWLLGVRDDQVEGHHPQVLELGATAAGDREDRGEAATHPALRRAHDAAPARTTSLASSKYASDPAQCGSWCVTGSPYDGASPTRTLRGITVSKTSDGKCSRTSRSTSRAKRVRPS